MASRYFFALCTLALIATVVAAPVEEVGVDDVALVDEERVWPAFFAAWAAAEGITWLYKRFVHVKAKCFPDVFKNCDINPVLHPKKYYNCADKYFKANADCCMKKEKN